MEYKMYQEALLGCKYQNETEQKANTRLGMKINLK